jgi:hypothetical protein
VAVNSVILEALDMETAERQEFPSNGTLQSLIGGLDFPRTRKYLQRYYAVLHASIRLQALAAYLAA